MTWLEVAAVEGEAAASCYDQLDKVDTQVK